MMLCGSLCYAAEPEAATTTTTQVKEQIQRIEVPSHIKGLHIVNNNTLRWQDPIKPFAYRDDGRFGVQDVYRKPAEPSRWQCTALGIVCTAVIYGAARSYVYLLAQELEKESHWWNWKSELSLSALTQIPEKQLAQELAAQIQQRYDKKTVNDVAFIMPLVHFIQDTNREQEYLEHLIKLYDRLRTYGSR